MKSSSFVLDKVRSLLLIVELLQQPFVDPVVLGLELLVEVSQHLLLVDLIDSLHQLHLLEGLFEFVGLVLELYLGGHQSLVGEHVALGDQLLQLPLLFDHFLPLLVQHSPLNVPRFDLSLVRDFVEDSPLQVQLVLFQTLLLVPHRDLFLPSVLQSHLPTLC